MGRGKRGSLASAAGEKEGAGPGQRRRSGGRAGGGRGWRAAKGGGAGPAEQGGLGGASAGRGGGTAGPTRRPASGLSPQSLARSRRLAPGRAGGGLRARQGLRERPCRTPSGLLREAAGNPPPLGVVHLLSFTASK